MRADIIKRWMDHKGPLPQSHEDNSDLTQEDWMAINLIRAVQENGNATAFNAVLDARYGKQATGQGAELSDNEGVKYEVSFRGVQNEKE